MWVLNSSVQFILNRFYQDEGDLIPDLVADDGNEDQDGEPTIDNGLDDELASESHGGFGPAQLSQIVDSIGQQPKRAKTTCKFSRETGEVWSTFCDSTMSRKKGDELLKWAGNPLYRGDQTPYRTIRHMANDICREYVPDGVMKADFTEELDGKQKLVFFHRDLYTVVKELLGDSRFAGRQYTQFESGVNSNGKRTFGAFNTGDVYRDAQAKAGPDVSPIPIFLSADKTYVLKSMSVHPIIGMVVFDLFHCH